MKSPSADRPPEPPAPAAAPPAVALLSGGLDSTVALALAQERGPIALALTIDYGQRAAAREIERSAALARHFGVAHRVVALPFFAELPGGGALLDRALELPRPDRATLERGGRAVEASAARVWVPNRNGVFVEVAAAFAEALGAGRVVVGFNREEAATFPDNSLGYLKALDGALAYSTRGHVRVEAPTGALDKAAIVAAAASRRLPLDVIWPCYEGGAAPCATCESCQRFLRACERAGVAAPWAPAAG
ncbi:MAG: 7-cyano-7-deazaguanine synthase QueC [Planctomycetes bacterium]|nr:7-cyano-7-deazaguanine synthase QueC [Planctomycetota bacterium]